MRLHQHIHFSRKEEVSAEKYPIYDSVVFFLIIGWYDVTMRRKMQLKKLSGSGLSKQKFARK